MQHLQGRNLNLRSFGLRITAQMTNLSAQNEATEEHKLGAV